MASRDTRALDPACAWMQLPACNVTLDATHQLIYDAALSQRRFARLERCPPDLEVAAYRINADPRRVVVAVRYGSQDGHTHLDVYAYLQGELVSATMVASLAQSFFGSRAGVALDIEHDRDVDGARWVCVDLSYCPARDPAAQRAGRRTPDPRDH